MSSLVKEVVTNTASFERSIASDSARDLTQLEDWGNGFAGGHSPQEEAPRESSHRLVIQPRHDGKTTWGPHRCPLCPANLCKVRPLWKHLSQRVGLLPVQKILLSAVLEADHPRGKDQGGQDWVLQVDRVQAHPHSLHL